MYRLVFSSSLFHRYFLASPKATGLVTDSQSLEGSLSAFSLACSLNWKNVLHCKNASVSVMRCVRVPAHSMDYIYIYLRSELGASQTTSGCFQADLITFTHICTLQ